MAIKGVNVDGSLETTNRTTVDDALGVCRDHTLGLPLYGLQLF